MTLAIKPRLAVRLLQTFGSWALFIAVETVTQVVLKMAGQGFDAAMGIPGMIVHALTTPVVWIGFGLYFTGFLVWLTILKDVDLGKAFPMTATVYIATLSAAVLVFHEHLTPMRLLGVCAILAGVGLLASDENSAKSGAVLEPVHGAGPVHGGGPGHG